MVETIDNDSTFTYDLRQRRAKVIADCIEDVVEACKSENYTAWLKNIDDLYSVSEHTFKDRDEARLKYIELRKRVVNLASKYASAWIGSGSNGLHHAEIDYNLRELFQFVMVTLEESGIFGTKWEDDGI